jgi:hypothetical protein
VRKMKDLGVLCGGDGLFEEVARCLSASVTTVDTQVSSGDIVGGIATEEDDRTHKIDLFGEC